MATHPLHGTAADFVWLLPLLPFLGFLANGWISLKAAYHRGPRDPSRTLLAGHTGEHHVEDVNRHDHEPHRHPAFALVSWIGAGVIGVAFVVALAIFVSMLGAPADAGPFVQTYGSWLPAGDLKIDWAFQLDQLSIVMALIITGIGFLIHVFSIGYMAEDPGYPRYFAYLNLFVFFMLTLVLGASYAVIFVGWEGVGLASYLLIGFWFSETANANAGKKAFIVNRVGDFGFLLAIFLIWSNLGTLDFVTVNTAVAQLPAGGAVVTAICLFLFLGCAGKSAQMPLYIWLPDAMAGPTPVSALIHAATMVTAGVYLVARSSALFALAPVASLTVVVVGTVTAFFAATIGLKQWDIKKVLAYSTVSQLGFMFVAVGIGAYATGVFHLVTHAFFKALLFLGAGAIIHALHEAYHDVHDHDTDPQDMRRMGGLRTSLPVTFAVMWIATLAIAGIPPFAGFFSKDAILSGVVERAQGSSLAQAHWLGIPGSALLMAVYVILVVTAFMTAIYMTRLMLYTFHGTSRMRADVLPLVKEPGWLMKGPLVALGVLSVAGGWLNLPTLLPLGPTNVLEHWLAPVTGAAGEHLARGASPLGESTEIALIAAAVVVAVLGIGFAVWRLKGAALEGPQEMRDSGVGYVLENKYFVDELIQRVLITPLVRASRVVLWRGIDVGLIDGVLVNGTGAVARGIAWVGGRLQSGLVGNYAWVIAVAVVALIGAMSFR